MFVQRKIESDGISSEDTKKLRTAETGNGDEEAGPVIEPDAGTTVNGSSLHESAGAGDENHMAVDIVANNGTTAVATDNVSTAADLPAIIPHSVSISSASDVIDVDAIETESSCDKAEKQESANSGNPLELGLNEFYLPPAGDEQPADDVIDIDDESTEAAGSSETADVTDAQIAVTTDAENTVIREQVEEKVDGDKTPEGDAERETASSELNNDKPDEAAAVVTDTEPASGPSSSSADQEKTSLSDAASENANSVSMQRAEDRSNEDLAADSRTEVQVTELAVESSAENRNVERLEAANVVKVVTDVAEMVAEVIERVIANEESRPGEAVIIGAHVRVEPPKHMTAEAGSGTSTSATSPRAAAEPEAEMVTVHTAPVAEDTSSPCDTEESTTKPVERECSEENESRSEEMVDEDSHTEVVKDSSEVTTSLHGTENETNAAEGKGAMDSLDGESPAQVVTGSVTVEVQGIATGVAASSAEEIRQTGEDVEQPTEMMQKSDIPLSEDMTDMAETGNAELAAKDVADEEHVSDSTETSQQPIEMIAETSNGEDASQCTETKDMAVTESTESAVSTDENTSDLKEMKDVAEVSEEKDEQQHADVTDEMSTAKNDVAQSSDMMDTDELPKESETLPASGKGDDECSQHATDVTDKVETAAADTEPRDDRVITDHEKISGMDKTGMELSSDKGSATGEIVVSEAGAEADGGKSEQEEMEITVDPVTSADAAAE